jgi:transposase
MVPHRNADALKGFFIEQGPRWCRGVQVVVSDGSTSYKTAIGAHLGHAKHVLDRFHVIRWFADGLTLVRRDLQRREPHGIKPAFDPEVFRARFLLLRRGDTLDDADQARLDQLFNQHPRLDLADESRLGRNRVKKTSR